MLVLFAVLSLLIGAYSYMTDAKRVRALAEGYLSELTGGRVTVEGASLSLFEGLRLDGVMLYVDADWQPVDGPAAPDALLFSARTIVMQYEPTSMLRGQLQARQIVVEKPQVYLSSNTETDQWNYNRLGSTRRPRPAPPSQAPSKPPPLPELLLRNARVEIAELQNGRNKSLGFIAIDGQLTPQSSQEDGQQDRMSFILQSRGLSDAMGPLVTGALHLDTGRIVAQLKQFEFGRDARSMLPAAVAQWWERHELGGRVDVPLMDYTPAAAGRPAKFRIETQLNGVTLSVPPEEWMSRTEVTRRDDARQSVAFVRDIYSAAGFSRAEGSSGVSIGATPLGPNAATTSDAILVLPPALEASAGDVQLGSSRAINPADRLVSQLESAPLQLRQVSGGFIFTEKGIDVRNLAGRVENNLLVIDGHIAGYDPEATVSMRIASGQNEDLHIPASPRYVWSLPHAAREFYEKIRPQGTCRVQFDIQRSTEGGPIQAGGYIELVDASFMIDEFPYPLRQTHGRIEVARDTATSQDWILFRGIRGLGVVGGPNANRQLAVDGWIGPVGASAPDPGGLIKIRVNDISTEPALKAAFDDDVREALALFDAPGKGEYPKFRGDVLVEVYKNIGAEGKFKVRVDLDIKEADGMMVGFPYPLRKLSGQVKVREGYAEINNIRVPHPTADISVNGRAAWVLKNFHPTGELARRKTDLKVKVRGLPIDDDLMAALPKESVEWITRTGVAGRIDVDGQLTGREGGLPYSPEGEGPSLNYELDIALRNGTLRPQKSEFVVSDVSGRMHLTPFKLDLLEVNGTRGEGKLAAVGQIILGEQPRSMLVASADNLKLDKALYSLLPADAQAAWDEVRPDGTLDGEITYASIAESPDEASMGQRTRKPAAAVTVVDLGAEANRQATQPTALLIDLPAVEGRSAIRRELPMGLHGVLRPREMSASILTVPYPLEKLSGEVAISPDRVEFRKISASHGKARLAINGAGVLWPTATWTLNVAARDLPADAELRKALPPSLSGLLDSVKAAGTLDLDLDKLVYRSSPSRPSPENATKPAGPELDLNGTLWLKDVSLDTGIVVEKMRGTITLAAAVRDSQLESLNGNLHMDSLQMAGRTVTELRAAINKPAHASELTLTKLQAAVGGGDLAGQVTLNYPDTGPARYTLSLFLRNADVRELGQEASDNVSGRVTASLALEGAWGKSGVRRGRGDVVVAGKEMYRMPLMLGLMQVTNLALPISSPFSSGTARYSVEGEKVTFERIELRSNNILMSGDGTLDFGSKQVRMNFVTDNPGAFKIPFVQDLWRGAQQELLRIHVRGTVEDPTVQNRPLGTFVTTVDEVFKGDAPRKKK